MGVSAAALSTITRRQKSKYKRGLGRDLNRVHSRDGEGREYIAKMLRVLDPKN